MRAGLARRALAPVIIITAAVVPYLRTLDAPFFFDDVKLVKENLFLREAYEDPSMVIATFDIRDRRWDEEELRPNYRPLRFLSYLADYALTRLLHGHFPPDDPPVFFFHLSNIVLHALNALLVLAIARSLAARLLAGGTCRAGVGDACSRDDGAAAFAGLAAALLFALHPIQTEAVTYVSGRRDVLSTFFVLLAIAVHLRGGSGAPRPSSIIAVPILLAAGLLSKEMAITLPALLLVIDIALRARPSPGRVVLHALAWTVALAHIAIVLSSPGLVAPGGGRDALSVASTACGYAARYLLLTIFPLRQSIDYSYDAIPESAGLFDPPGGILAALLVAGLAALGIRAIIISGGLRGSGSPAAGGRWAGVGILWFLGTLVPVLQVVPIAERFAERFAYLPSIGIVLLAAGALLRARRIELRLGWGLLGLVSLVFCAATVRRNGDWESPLRLWTSAVEAQPRAARAHLGRAHALRDAGRLRDAVDEYTAAIEIFSRKPDVPLHHGFILQALTMRGGAFGLLGKDEPALLDRAVEDYRRVLASNDTDGTPIESSPKHTVVHFDLAGFLLQRKDLDGAEREYGRVLEIGTPVTLAAAAEYYLGKIALLRGDARTAAHRQERALEKIPRDDPSRLPVAIELVDLLIDGKELDRASAVIDRALERGLEGKAAGREGLHLRYREARILDRRGDLNGCRSILEGILLEDPAYAPALLTLGRIEAGAGRLDAAEERYKSVLRRDPGNAEAAAGLRDTALRRSLKKEPGSGGGEAARLLGPIEEKGKGHFSKGELFAARDVYIELLSRARAEGSKEFQAAAIRELGRIGEKLGRVEEAERFFTEAIGLLPDGGEAHRYLADLLLRRRGDREGARVEYERYLARLPDGRKGDPLVHFNLAGLLAKSDPSRAIKHCLDARAAGHDSPLVDRTLGYLYAEIGAWKDSLGAFQRYFEAGEGGGEEDPARDAAREFVRQTVLPRVLER